MDRISADKIPSDKEMTRPVRVLHVLGGVGLGGAESRIMDLYRCMDRSKVQFDFLVHGGNAAPGRPLPSSEELMQSRAPEFYDQEIGQLGGHIYALPKFTVVNWAAYRRAARRFFEEHPYFEIVQGHMTSTAAIYLPEAKKAGVKITIAHVRSAGVDPGPKGWITRWIRKPLRKRTDYCFACSELAGKAVYGKRWMEKGLVRILPNAIDARRFAYRPDVRERMRRELRLGERFCVGHVGRFHYAKNHEFLLDIYAALCGMWDGGEPPALVLVGDGPGLGDIREKAGKLGLEKQVLFMGGRKNVEDYYQAFDFFCFPSRFEGLPGTVVEAQAAGLRCLVSDAVTREVAVTDLVAFEGIAKPASIWAAYMMKNRVYERRDTCRQIEQADFDVKRQAAMMQEFYLTQGHRPQAEKGVMIT